MSSRESVVSLVHRAVSIGSVTGVIIAAGVSPSQASIETILEDILNLPIFQNGCVRDTLHAYQLAKLRIIVLKLFN